LAPEPVWTLWRREKSVVPASNRAPAVQLVAIPVELVLHRTKACRALLARTDIQDAASVEEQGLNFITAKVYRIDVLEGSEALLLSVLLGHSIARVNTEWHSNCSKLEQVTGTCLRGSEDIKAYPSTETAATRISQNLIWI
jgi:hypothetical protein